MDYGICQIVVNSDPASSPIDLYDSWVAHDPPVDLGMHAFHAGGNAVTITIIGMNPKSAGTKFGLDYLLVQTGP
jgi:hypothetical protein